MPLYQKMKKTVLILSALILLLCAGPLPAARADSVGYLARGVGKVLTSVFCIPADMIKDSGRVMFPFGLLTGAVKGTARTVGGLLSGATDIARGAAPYAKYLVFL